MHFQHLSKIALAISVAFLSAGASAESNQVVFRNHFGAQRANDR